MTTLSAGKRLGGFERIELDFIYRWNLLMSVDERQLLFQWRSSKKLLLFDSSDRRHCQH